MPKKGRKPIGHHYIVEASGCDPEIISSVSKVQQILVKAAEIAGATVWAVSFKMSLLKKPLFMRSKPSALRHLT